MNNQTEQIAVSLSTFLRKLKQHVAAFFSDGLTLTPWQTYTNTNLVVWPFVSIKRKAHTDSKTCVRRSEPTVQTVTNYKIITIFFFNP